MISAVKLKGYVIDTNIFSIIVGKLHHKKKLCQIILIQIDKSPKIDFYCVIWSFGLVVCLRVNGDGKFLLDVKKIT